MAETKAQVYRRGDGQFDWRILSSNGRTLGGSDQGYTERNDAVEGLERTIAAIVNDILALGRYEVLTDATMVVEVEIVDKATPGENEFVQLAVPFTAPEEEPAVDPIATETDPMQT